MGHQKYRGSRWGIKGTEVAGGGLAAYIRGWLIWLGEGISVHMHVMCAGSSNLGVRARIHACPMDTSGGVMPIPAH